MSERKCSCPEHPWRFYHAGERAEYPGGEKGCKFWNDLWERVTDDLGLDVDQHRADEEGNFYCDRCGSQLHGDGTSTPQVPWARAQQAERQLEKALLEAIHLGGLLAVLDEALQYGDIIGGMYRERTLEGEKVGEDMPMWMGPLVRNGACKSAKELAEEFLRDGFRQEEEDDVE